jgi:hypothetical protein
MTKEEFYKLFPKDSGIFSGVYDARNGKVDFMYGVKTVIEYLACQVSDEFADEITREFFINMVKSEKSVKNYLTIEK